MTGDRSTRFKLGEGEVIHKLGQGNSVLKPETDRDGKTIQNGPVDLVSLIQIDEDLTEPSVLIFTGPEIHLVS